MKLHPDARALLIVAALCGLARINPVAAALAALVAAFVAVRRELLRGRPKPTKPPKLAPVRARPTKPPAKRPPSR